MPLPRHLALNSGLTKSLLKNKPSPTDQMKTYIVTEAIYITYEVEAKNATEAQDLYAKVQSNPKKWRELLEDAVINSWGDINVEEA